MIEHFRHDLPPPLVPENSSGNPSSLKPIFSTHLLVKICHFCGVFESTQVVPEIIQITFFGLLSPPFTFLGVYLGDKFSMATQGASLSHFILFGWYWNLYHLLTTQFSTPKLLEKKNRGKLYRPLFLFWCSYEYENLVFERPHLKIKIIYGI